MPIRDRLELQESLQAGKTTFRKASREPGARHARIGEFVLADERRGRRQAPAICRRAGVADWLEIGHATDEQLDRVEDELA
jgi:hypothetical protein